MGPLLLFTLSSGASEEQIEESVLAMIEKVQAYVPGYRLKQKIQFERFGSNNPVYIRGVGTLEGIKTIAYEVVAQLGAAPDVVVTPVGGGDMLAAQWRGYLELKRAGVITRLPRMIAVNRATRWAAISSCAARSVRTPARSPADDGTAIATSMPTIARTTTS